MLIGGQECITLKDARRQADWVGAVSGQLSPNLRFHYQCG